MAFVFMILYPLFLRPWNIVLSNKRLILRQQYWNIGRFSRVISFNLSKLDTQRITPRIKPIPITIGFTIIFSFSFVLIEFALRGSVPTPLILQILLFLGGSIGFLVQVQKIEQNALKFIFDPFLHWAIPVALLSLLIGIGLIIFGLPRRTQMSLSTIGGHRLNLNAGVEDDLTDLLYAVGRKHRIKTTQSKWKWDLPLLDDERILTYARIGLIDRNVQILGLFSLILFIDSIDEFVKLLADKSVQSLILTAIKLINLLFIWITISFAKKYSRIIATTHRLLFQQERKQVSGTFGKRVYFYHDFPFEYIQGFSYSNFSGIRLNTIIGIGILVIASTALINVYSSARLIILTFVAIGIYAVVNYKTFTTLRFSSLGGDKIELVYATPSFIASLSHKLEGRKRIYSKIFENLLSENEVASVCNTIRDVTDPVQDISDTHEITVDAFIDKKEECLGSWEKIGPFRFNRLSIVLGFTIGLIAMFNLVPNVDSSVKTVFVIVSLTFLIVAGARNLVLKHRTLIILNNRLFYINEILPRKVARIFGILPEKQIEEVNLDYILISRFKFIMGTNKQQLYQQLLIFGILGYLLLWNESIIESIPGTVGNVIFLIISIFFVTNFIPLSRAIFENLPKYSLQIYSRFGKIQLPFMKDLHKFNQVIRRAKSQ